MVMYHKKAGRLVLAVPCKFTCLADVWKYQFIEPDRLERKSNSKLLHFNIRYNLQIVLTILTFLLRFFLNCLYGLKLEVTWVHYLVYFCFKCFWGKYLADRVIHDRILRIKENLRSVDEWIFFLYHKCNYIIIFF